MKQTTQLQMDKCASAKSHNLSISTKHAIEISRQLRFRSVAYAKRYLEDVLSMDRAVPFKRYTRDVGHKRGPLGPGRFPIKAAAEFLRVIKGVEANAQAKGLNSASLKIVKLVANKASIPFTGGRQRHGTKRTHLEVVVQEMKVASKSAKKPAKKKTPVAASAKKEDGAKNEQGVQDTSASESSTEKSAQQKPTQEESKESKQETKKESQSQEASKE